MASLASSIEYKSKPSLVIRHHNHGSLTAIIVNAKKVLKLRITPGPQFQKGAKWIPYLRTENFKNDTLFHGTYLCSLYMGVPPLPCVNKNLATF